MRDIPRFTVVPTYNRPAELHRCLAAIGPQTDVAVVINNGDPIPDPPAPTWPDTLICNIELQPVNLSKMWNAGIAAARTVAAQEQYPVWDVAVLNDDAVCPPRWYDAMSAAMRNTGAAAASQHPFDQPGTVHIDDSGQPSVATRLVGWAFLLRGELGLRFDERFAWWCGDDDMSIRCRMAGGIVHVGGHPAENTLANTSTVGPLAVQAARDVETYAEKWGIRPW